MIIEQIQNTITLMEALDILAGWRNLDYLIFAYIRTPPKDSSQLFVAVGIFVTSSGSNDRPVNGQKEVADVIAGESLYQNLYGKGTGLEVIAEERHRQIFKEGFTPVHDVAHKDESMAMVAACYASPEPILKHTTFSDGRHLFSDPWPIKSWGRRWDKRDKHPRVKQLAIAGALCAAEIDRLKAIEFLIPDPPLPPSVTCKGSYVLGTACGKCERCRIDPGRYKK